MYVGWNMNRSLYTVTPDTNVFRARELMDSHHISHLPVTDGKARLLGILTDRDLRDTWASPATTLSVHELRYLLEKITVESVMNRKVITASPEMTIERSAFLMIEHKIGCLPVTKGERLVGIITITDMTRILLTAMGIMEGSRRMVLLARDRVGILADVGKLMQQAGINILSVMSRPLTGAEYVWQMLIRVSEPDFDSAVATLRDAGFQVLTDYVEDISRFIPEK